MKKENNKKNLAVIFGGRSVEHDISIITGVQVLNAVNKQKYNVIPIYITKNGEFFSSNDFFNIKTFSKDNFIAKNCKRVCLLDDSYLYFYKNKRLKQFLKIDFALLATHGGIGENGGLQGYLDVCNIPYSSPNNFCSSVCMNKLATKKIFKSQNIPVTNYFSLSQIEYNKGFEKVKQKIKNLKMPLIVKPANLGSSIGITFCKNLTTLKNALSFAFLFDNVVLIEEAVENLREFNISVMGNKFSCELSDIEEVIIKKDFLSFENKYLNKENSSKGIENTLRKFPAELDSSVVEKIKEISLKTFSILECKGIVRFDFLMNSITNEIYLNEVNTIPGSLSNYLWVKKGYNFEKLLGKIIDYSLEDKKDSDSKITNFSSNVLKQFDGLNKLNFKK